MVVSLESFEEPWRTPFVGRVPELTTLRSRLTAAEHGRTSIVLLAGEPGIGKTRTAEELCATAARRGALVHWGHCFEGEGAPAFWPWIQILRSWIRGYDPEVLRAALGRGAADVGLLLPDVRDLLTDLPQPTPLDPAQARFRLFDSVATFLRRSATRPCVLVLDDLHWADEPSLLLLEFLAAHVSDAPILIIGIYRDVELTPGDALSRTLGGLIRHPHVQRIVLGRLSSAEVVHFIEATPDVRATAPLARSMLDRAEGNPLFVGEMLRLLQSEGTDGRPTTDASMLVPPTLHDVIGRRLSQVSDACRRVLTVAAVIGREFDLTALRAAAPDDARTIEALDEAEALRIIAPAAAGEPPVRFRFTHALVRDALYAALPANRRARLHLQVGTALEQMPDAPTETRLSELAHHFVQASSVSTPERVSRHVQRAAQRAVDRLAYEEGARLYALALRVLDAGPTDDLEARCELLLLLGTVQSQMTDDAASRESFLAAAALARGLVSTVGAPRAAHLLAQAALGYGGLPRLEHRILDARGVDLLEEALAAVGDVDSTDRARLLARLGTARSWTEAGGTGTPASQTASQTAIEVARRLADPQALADGLVSRYHSLTIAEDLDEAMVLCDEVEALADRLGNVVLSMDCKRWRLKYMLEVGDLAAADVALADYARQMREHRHPYAEWRIAVARMSRALLVGELDIAEQAAAEAADLGPRQARQGAPWFVAGELHLLRAKQGRLQEAESLLDELCRDYPRTHGIRCARAWVWSERGDLEAARGELATLAATGFAELRHGGAWNYSITFLAQLAANLDDRDRAALLYDLLLPQARYNVVSGVTFTSYGAAAYYLARLAATLGRPDAAAHHFEDAIALHERLRAGPLLALTRASYAADLLAGRATGTRDLAGEQARLARDAAESLGLPLVRQRAADLLATAVPDESAPMRPPGHPTSTGARAPRHPDGLTAREVEILGLLAAGATNASIAESLVLSTGTVHWYTVKIYQKIGVRGRAEAAAYAARLGLTGQGH